MQTISLAVDTVGTQGVLVSAEPQISPKETPTDYQFGSVLKNIREKAADAKTTPQKMLKSDPEKSQDADDVGDLSADKGSNTNSNLPKKLQSSSETPQQNQLQNPFLAAAAQTGLCFSFVPVKEQPGQYNTNTASVQANPLSTSGKSSLLSENEMLLQTLQPLLSGDGTQKTEDCKTGNNQQETGMQGNVDVNKNNSMNLDFLAVNRQIQQQNSALFKPDATLNATISSATNTGEAILSDNSAVNQIKNLVFTKKASSQLSKASELSMPTEPGSESSDISLQNAKTVFPVQLKQDLNQSGNVANEKNFLVSDELGSQEKVSDPDIPQFSLTGYKEVLFSNTASTSSVEAAQPAPVNDPNNIIEQIVDQVRLTNNAKSTEMVIKLKPEHLGELTLKIAVNNGSVTATFHSNNSDVRNVLEGTMVQFKQEMANAGVKVNYVGVYAGLDQFFSGGQQGNSGQYMQSAYHPQNEREAFKETEAWTASQVTDIHSNGVDYRI